MVFQIKSYVIKKSYDVNVDQEQIFFFLWHVDKFPPNDGIRWHSLVMYIYKIYDRVKVKVQKTDRLKVTHLTDYGVLML